MRVSSKIQDLQSCHTQSISPSVPVVKRTVHGEFHVPAVHDLSTSWASQGGTWPTLENPNVASQGAPAKIAKHRTVHLGFLENWVPKCMEKSVASVASLSPLRLLDPRYPPRHIDTPRHGHKGQLRGHASHRQTRRDEFATQLQLGQGDIGDIETGNKIAVLN